jgi:GNAT superfamily N-acetyltransferase
LRLRTSSTRVGLRKGRKKSGFEGSDATLLARECVHRAKALKISTIYLYTGTFMQAARHIYEKLGFQRAPEFDRDPGPIAYRLDL